MVAMSAIFSCRAMSAADRVIVVPVPASLRDWITFAGTLITLAALVVAIVTLRWSVKQWRWTYFTKEWSTLMHFLKDDARFMDAENAANYKTAFAGEDRMKYDVIARLCIGYLDDLYFLGSEKEMCTWFRGTMRLFAVTHRAWLEDNRDAYDPRFYRFISSWTKSEQ
jgi:hypothetical protein